jgi:hypothetical protein
VLQAVSEHFETLAVYINQILDLVRAKSCAHRLATRIGQKLLACEVVNINPR